MLYTVKYIRFNFVTLEPSVDSLVDSTGWSFQAATVKTSLTTHFTVQFKGGTSPYSYINLRIWSKIYTNRLSYSNMAANAKIYYGNP